MKTALALVTLAALAVGTAALATPSTQQQPSDAEVQRVIDARLHQMLVQLNARR